MQPLRIVLMGINRASLLPFLAFWLARMGYDDTNRSYHLDHEVNATSWGTKWNLELWWSYHTTFDYLHLCGKPKQNNTKTFLALDSVILGFLSLAAKPNLSLHIYKYLFMHLSFRCDPYHNALVSIIYSTLLEVMLRPNEKWEMH